MIRLTSIQMKEPIRKEIPICMIIHMLMQIGNLDKDNISISLPTKQTAERACLHFLCHSLFSSAALTNSLKMG